MPQTKALTKTQNITIVVSAAMVAVSAVALSVGGGTPTMAAIGPEGITIQAAIAPPPPLRKERKVVVLLYTYQDRALPSNIMRDQDIDAIRRQLFTNPLSTKAYHDENSFNQIKLQGKIRPDGDIYGYFQIPSKHTECTVGSALVGEVNQKAIEAGIDLSGYDHYIYTDMGTGDPSICGGSHAPIGGNIVGVNFDLTGESWDVIAHEIGHNLGLYHAGTWECWSDGQRVPLSAKCNIHEGGDPFDIMGSIGAGSQMNTYHKAQLGLYEPQNILEASVPGDYTLVPLEQRPSPGAPSQVQALMMLRGTLDAKNGTPEYFYLEQRAPIGNFIYREYVPGKGFVPNSTSPVYDGISVRVATHHALAPWIPKLIDVTPLDSPEDSSLKVGQMLIDPESGVAFTTKSFNRGVSATVNIFFIPCTLRSPAITMPPYPASGSILGNNYFIVRPGATFPMTFLVTNQNTFGCSTPNDVTLTSTLPSEWLQAPLPATISLGSRRTESITLSLTIPQALAEGQRVYINTLSTSSGSPSVEYSTYIRIDGTPPRLTLTAPADGSVLSKEGTVTISAQAADNLIDDFFIQIFIDDVVQEECVHLPAVGRCQYIWNLDGVSLGSHIIRVKVADIAGNVAEETRTVFREVPEPTTFRRGYINADDNIDLSDSTYLLTYLFIGGQAPVCRDGTLLKNDAADVNDDGGVDLSDATYLLSYLFIGGPEPKSPFQVPGPDLTSDDIPSCP